jgi:hypothetical protein
MAFLGCTDSSGDRGIESNTSSVNNAISRRLARIRANINLSGITIDTVNNLFFATYPIGIANERTPGPTDYNLICTFKILRNNSLPLEQTGTLTKPLEMNDSYYKDSLPPQVIKDLFTADTFKEKKVYSAAPFYFLSYREGFFIVNEDSTVYLHMYTM